MKTNNLIIEVKTYPCTSYLFLEVIEGELPKVYNEVHYVQRDNCLVITTLQAGTVEEALALDIESLESWYLKLVQLMEKNELDTLECAKVCRVLLNSLACVPTYTRPEVWFKDMDIGEIVLNMISTEISIDSLVAEELAEAKELEMWLEPESVRQWLLNQSRNRLRVMNATVRSRLEKLVGR